MVTKNLQIGEPDRKMTANILLQTGEHEFPEYHEYQTAVNASNMTSHNVTKWLFFTHSYTEETTEVLNEQLFDCSMELLSHMKDSRTGILGLIPSIYACLIDSHEILCIPIFFPPSTINPVCLYFTSFCGKIISALQTSFIHMLAHIISQPNYVQN